MSVPGEGKPVTSNDIQRVTVLGAGSMGHGIAEVAAIAGYDVVLRDVEEELVRDGYEQIEWSVGKLAEKGRVDDDPDEILGRIDTEVDLETAVADADLVIEAAPEKMDLKKEIFADLDAYAPDGAILGTNTSTLSITEISEATDRPAQVVGIHFFNPVVKMDLVEVIHGDHTSEETIETAYAFAESLDKTPIHVRKDVRGFVVNSVFGPFGNEAAWMVSNDEASIREIDATMVHERGYPMGPFELGDMGGLDIGYHALTEAGDPVPPILQEKIDAGDLGQKTGRGYYDYEDGDGADYTLDDVSEDVDWLRIEARMINEAARLIQNDVATAEEIDTGMKLGTAFPEGPCRRADKLGLDRIVEKLDTLHEETGEDRYEPADYLVDLVEAGETGEDAGAGFYGYGGGGGERTYHAIDVSREGDGGEVLAIELDRPERLNSMNEDMADEIEHALDSVDVDEIRCVTVEGTGDRAFCAGADIGGFASMDAWRMARDTAVTETLAEFPKPTIAKIQGYALGGGLELALACDLQIATEGSELGFPETGLGIIPGTGGTQRAMRLIGETRAKELVFRGEHIDAERAEEWALINRAVPEDEFEDVCQTFVDDVCDAAPLAQEFAKRIMDEGAEVGLEAGLLLERQGAGLLLETDDAREGTQAFAEDREPEFEGK